MLKREPRLQFQPPVVSGFRKARAAEAADAVGLIGLAEARRFDVADYRAWIVAVQDITHGHRNGQQVAATGRRGVGARAAEVEGTALDPPSVTTVRAGCSPAASTLFSSEGENLRNTQVEKDNSGSAAKVT